jgi:pimeloyl-ACP methyl ester carboxylesterase
MLYIGRHGRAPANFAKQRGRMMNERKIATAHGDISLLTAGESGPAVLFIHGNSSSKEVWRRQYDSELAAGRRFVVMDLPGHGASSDAPDPQAAYCMGGYAEAAVAVLNELGIDRVAVIGWSLGGHIAIEMIPMFAGIAGILISGTPPVHTGDMESISSGFHLNECTSLGGQQSWTPAEAELFASTALVPGESAPDWALAAAIRTDSRARQMMFAAFMAGRGGDHAEIVAGTKVPTAVINGADDPFINNDFVRAAVYGNLWRNEVMLLDGLSHAPFWQAPEIFNALLAGFLSDLTW